MLLPVNLCSTDEDLLKERHDEIPESAKQIMRELEAILMTGNINRLSLEKLFQQVWSLDCFSLLLVNFHSGMLQSATSS